MSNQIMKIFDTYGNALSRRDFKAVFETMSDNIVWHMGGEDPLSSIVVGKQALGERLGEFAKRSNATFRLIINWAANNDCFVVTSVVSLAKMSNDKLKAPVLTYLE